MTADFDRLHILLTAVEAVLFDFDGPLCDVFAGFPAWEVAQQLQEMVGTRYETDDPLEVLRRANAAKIDGADDLEDALIAAELVAVSTSATVKEGVNAMRTALSTGVQVGVVSNNSARAVASFLDNLGLSKQIQPIVGRAYRRPDLMKPNPWPMNQAFAALNVAPDRVAYIGDSITDIEVSKITGASCIAYANKPAKRRLFTETGVIVIDNMQDVVRALAVRRQRGSSATS